MRTLLFVVAILSCVLSSAQDQPVIKWSDNAAAHALIDKMIREDSVRLTNINDFQHYNYISSMVYNIKDAKFNYSFYGQPSTTVTGGIINMQNLEAVFNTQIEGVKELENGWLFSTYETFTKRGKTKEFVIETGIFVSNSGKVIFRYLPKFAKDDTTYGVVLFANPEIEEYFELASN